MTAEALLLAALIFGLRVMNSAIGTVRTVMIMQHRIWIVSILAFVETLIFAITIASVVTDLSNILNLAAYSSGFAVGNYFGMMLEQRLVTGYLTANIILNENGHDLAVALRAGGFGVTETIGIGQEGTVTMLRSVVIRQDMPGLVKVVNEISPGAFITTEEARAVHRGWLRAARHQK